MTPTPAGTRANALDLLKQVESALQRKELELRQVQKSLLEALRLVNGLLEVDNAAIESMLADANAATSRLSGPAPVAAAAAAAPSPTLAWEQPAKRFP